MKNILLVTLIAIILFTGCQTVHYTQVDAALFTISTGIKKDFEAFSLSPDGNYAVYEEKNRLYVYSIEHDEIYFTGPEDLKSFNAYSMQWSPDSRYLVFDTNIHTTTTKDSDIYLLDLHEKKIENITDEGIDSTSLMEIIKQGGTVNLDETPVWSPDSDAIIFRRQKYDKEKKKFFTYFYLMQLEDMKAEPILQFTKQFPFDVSIQFYWRSKKFYYIIKTSLSYSVADGIWEIPYSGSTLRQRVSWEEYRSYSKPQILEVSKEGAVALQSKSKTRLDDQSIDLPYTEYSLFEIMSKETRILNLLAPSVNNLSKAALSPNRELVLLVYENEDKQSVLVAQDILGETENTLFTGDKITRIKVVNPSKGTYIILTNHYDGTSHFFTVTQNEPLM